MVSKEMCTSFKKDVFEYIKYIFDYTCNSSQAILKTVLWHPYKTQIVGLPATGSDSKVLRELGPF